MLRTEGLLAFRDRTLDRIAEARRRRSFSPAPPGWRPSPVPVLTISPTPPAPRLGGVQTYLLRKLDRDTALLYPERDGWRLEVQGRSLTFPGIEDAVQLVGAERVHVEGLAGLSPRSLRFPNLTIALHDFAAFCPRPHLLEKPALRFCWYSRDLARCGKCLRQDWDVDDAFQAERRAEFAELLASASELIFPSDFLRRTYNELFPGLPLERQKIVEPGQATAGPMGKRPVRHVAMVGGVQPHKGALVFEEVVRLLPNLRFSAYGGGDPELLVRLRRLGVRVRGYYRHGTLPDLLRRDRVDLALLLSIVPESYSLVLDECVAAGVPVVAFDLGAVADRLPRLGAGTLVPLQVGAAGIAAVCSAAE